MGVDEAGPVEIVLRGLRRRADEDFDAPPAVHESGRHTVELGELGLRVSLTRARYPNRADGVDQYAITISDLSLDHPPAEAPTRRVLAAAFGEAAGLAVERRGGPAVRMFRVPVASPGGGIST